MSAVYLVTLICGLATAARGEVQSSQVYKNGELSCGQISPNLKVYCIVKAMEHQLFRDELALFSLDQALFPSFDKPKTAVVAYLYIHISVDVQLPEGSSNSEDQALKTYDYSLQWTSSWIFGQITLEYLLIVDNSLAKLIFDSYIGHPKQVDLYFHFNSSGQALSDEHIEMAVLLFAAQVSYYSHDLSCLLNLLPLIQLDTQLAYTR